MKSIKSVFINTDMEGASGVTSFVDQAYDGSRYNEDAKKLLTAEVNAAVEVLASEGVEDILVFDGHGSGAICFEMLHPAAKLLHGRPLSPKWATEILPRYQTSMIIGQHAMCGVEDGTLNHTQSSRTVEHYKLNGELIGETAQFALCCGAYGIPLIFLSGDIAACREAEALLPGGLATAAVKEGLSRTSAISLSQPAAHAKIREGVKAAIKRQLGPSPIKPFKWKGPFVLEKRYLFTDSADGAEKHKLFFERVDAKTVRFRSKDIAELIYT